MARIFASTLNERSGQPPLREGRAVADLSRVDFSHDAVVLDGSQGSPLPGMPASDLLNP
jgi:hypothetical protein